MSIIYPFMIHTQYSPSLMCGNLLRLEDEINLFKHFNIPYVHLDVMDAHFVPNICLGFGFVNQIQETSIPRDIHLMIENPHLAIEKLELSKHDIVTFHVEATQNPSEVISHIKKRCNAGIALKTSTPLESILPYLLSVDYVYVMTIDNAGFAGQTFNSQSYSRVEQLSLYLKDHKLNTIIAVDGGIGFEQIRKFKDLGASHFVLGTSAVYNKDGVESNLKHLFELKRKLDHI